MPIVFDLGTTLLRVIVSIREGEHCQDLDCYPPWENILEPYPKIDEVRT